MKTDFRALLFCLSLMIVTSCSSPPASSNQASSNRNTNTAVSNSSTGNSNNHQASQSSKGSIEVSSVPPGARVLLISNEESGAGEPESKGLTPTTITGIEPGKYTVNLERQGYKYFQKEITVKAGATVKVNGTLKKQ